MNPLPMGFLTLSIYLTFSFSLFHLTKPLCHSNERTALLQFKETFLIISSTYCSSKTASWNLEENSECCSWDGVKCNEDTGYVIELDLSNSCLQGSINSSSALFNLVHLQSLDLYGNDFSYSQIPSAIKNLSKLSYLVLSRSNFSGQIPSEILELSQLESLDLSANSLLLRQPSLKSVVEKLTKLKKLDLNWINISSSIPNNLGNLSSLTHLSLMDCQLQGVIPSSLGNLSKLAFLDISSNEFLGDLPISIANLASLQRLFVSRCQFSDQVQSSLSNLTQLNDLDLSNSKISGHNSCTLSWLPKLTKLTHLYLSNSNLVGEIPLWLINLTQLTDLKMSQNQLTGPIPYWLMNLNQLSYLDFSSNQLTGQIPSQISNLTKLGYLDLSSNRLQGPIPNSISEIKNLQYLDLHSNNLNETVELDGFLLKLENLEELSFSSNNLSVLTKTTGTTNLQKLLSIGLRSCNLIEFPNFLQNCDQLLGLDLSSNKMSGQIPKWFFNVSVHSLESLNLSNNLFTGFDQRHVVLPWTDLLTLDLRSNRLQGSLPLPTSSINHYLVSNNNLTGEIPSSICTLNHIQALDLSHNNLSGVLPRCLGNFSDWLSVICLQSNNFYGSIPRFFMIGSSLRMIDLSQNKLQGKIPRSLANCTLLEFLNIGYNQINDLFPSWLGILPELKVLILKSNRFHGVLKEPKTNFEFSKLHIIDLSHNMFMGELPSKYFQSWNAMKVVNESQLTYMQESLETNSAYFIGAYLDGFSSYDYSLIMSNQGTERKYWKIPTILTSIILSGNHFTGQIPTSISNLRGLIFLNLSHNHLLGHIPSSLGNLRLLESLDLSSNRLSGEIPPQLADLTFLGFFNVSNNLLEGRIPQGKQFDTFKSSSFEGNPGLCGKPLSKGCGNSDASEKREDQGSVSSTYAFDWKIVLTGFVSGLIVGVILGNEYFTKIVEWFATKNLGWQLKTAIKRKTRGHRN